MKEDILIVDDEEDNRALIAGLLEDEGYQPICAANDKEALLALSARQPSLVVLDVWLTGSKMDGLQILTQIRQSYPDAQVIMISGHATIEIALKALRIGAYDFITKPFKSAELFHIVERALKEAKLRKENSQLNQLIGTQAEDEIIGTSDAIGRIKRQIPKIADGTSRIFISGERGTGKSTLARYIHQNSPRSDAAFIRFNCAAYSADAIEKMLFGVEAGNHRPREIGALEEAHGGSLFLDEVHMLPLSVQQKLLKYMLKSIFIRHGGDQEIKVDARIMAASTNNMDALIQAGGLSGDFFNRLAVFKITMPAFHERKEDLAKIAALMLEKACRKHGRRTLRLSGSAIMQLTEHHWAGNGLELARTIEHLLEICSNELLVIDAELWDRAVLGHHGENDFGDDDDLKAKNKTAFALEQVIELSLREARDLFEKAYIEQNLLRHQQNISRTAQSIGMDRAALHRKMKMLGIGESNDQEAG